MRTIKTSGGAPITLDGDLLSVMEALYQEVTAKRELERSFEDMVKEIHHLIEQMDDQELRSVAMHTITTSTGAEIALDGDLLAIMETLYREVTIKRDLDRSFEDMLREINHLIDQMDEAERRAYLIESLFLNTVKYENDKLEAYMRRIAK